MSAAAVKEKVGERVGRRLRGKLKGIAVLRGEVALNGKGAAIGGGLGAGDLLGEFRDARIEVLGKLEITLWNESRRSVAGGGRGVVGSGRETSETPS